MKFIGIDLAKGSDSTAYANLDKNGNVNIESIIITKGKPERV